MSRGRKRLREVKDATKALQPAETKAAGVRLYWKMPDGTRRELGVPGPEKPSVQIELTGRDPADPPAWFSDDLDHADATVDAALAAGVDVDPQLVATRRRRGQRPRTVEPTLCDGADPHCQGCRDIAAVMYSRRQARARPRVAVGLNFSPFAVRYS